MTGRPPSLAALVALALVAAASCDRAVPPAAVAPETIAVDRANVVVKTGMVGVGDARQRASYVLVPARNRGKTDVVATLRGQLVGPDGARFPLLPESLRVPAGGERVFALVDVGQAPRPAGARAEVVVSSLLAVDYAPEVKVSDGRVFQDQGRAVVAANLENTAALEAKVSVIAAFYDADGRPMERPFTVVVLTGGGKRGVQLVGPTGSTGAQLYLGEVQY